MRCHNLFFYSSTFFLLGVLLSSFGFKSTILKLFIITLALVVSTCLIAKKKSLIVVSLLLPLVLIGAVFYTYHNQNFQNQQTMPFNKKISFTGEVASNPKTTARQEFKLKLNPPLNGAVLVKSRTYPKLQYGDKIELSGSIENLPQSPYGKYLLKEKVHGASNYPEIKIISKSAPSLKKNLFRIKSKVITTFQKILPYQESAFLSGIILGARDDFSKNFKEAMSKSGTTHLVALSGYNITIIITAIAATLGILTTRKKSFLISLVIIILFVIMTGAEASIVRAAIMGVIAALSPLLGRLYSPRNIIILAALIMTLENPNVLAYDIGFQLSFLALIGIIYLQPILKKTLKIKDGGFLAWRENLTITAAAQLMVAPILITQFGSLSATSLIANIIILELIPATMLIGAIVALTSLIAYNLSLIASWIAIIPLRFELGIINIFAKLTIPINPNLNLPVILIYYAAITGLILFAGRRKNP